MGPPVRKTWQWLSPMTRTGEGPEVAGLTLRMERSSGGLLAFSGSVRRSPWNWRVSGVLVVKGVFCAVEMEGREAR